MTNHRETLLGLEADRGARGSSGRRQLERCAVRVGRMQYYGTPPNSFDVAQYLLGALDIDAAPVDLVVVRELECPVDAHVRSGHRRRSKIVFWADDHFMQGIQVGLQNLYRSRRV